MTFPDRNNNGMHEYQAALQKIIDAGVCSVFFVLTAGDTRVVDMFLRMLTSHEHLQPSIFVVLTDTHNEFENALFEAMDHPLVHNRRIGILNVPMIAAMFH